MRIHIVQKGDTLWKIAKKYNVDFAQLKSLNSHLSDPNMIMPGMKIKIPSGHSPSQKHYKEMPKKEAPIKEAPIKEAPIKEMPVPAPPPMPELPKYPIHEESPEFLPPIPEPELPIEAPPVPMPPMYYKPIHHKPMSPCGCGAPIMPMPCQPIHWPGYHGHYHGYGYGNMMPPMPTMGAMEEESSSSSSYDTDYDNASMYGYGSQGLYGQQQDMYGAHMPMYEHHQGMYGQHMPMQSQQYEPYYHPQMMMRSPQLNDEHTMPTPSYEAPLFSEDDGGISDKRYQESTEETEEDEN